MQRPCGGHVHDPIQFFGVVISYIVDGNQGVLEPCSGGSTCANECQLPLDTKACGGLDPRTAWCSQGAAQLPAFIQLPGKAPPVGNCLPAMLPHTVLPDPLPFQPGVLKVWQGAFKLSGAIPQLL